MAGCADGDERIPVYPTEVVDTAGASDAFMTGLIDVLKVAAFCRRHLPSRGQVHLSLPEPDAPDGSRPRRNEQCRA
jgi:hypothetical protein